MKRLTLLRHAKSSWDHAGLADHDRPLAKRGRRDAPLMGERLARHGLKPDLVLTSSATRARETADLVAGALDLQPDAIRVAADIYLATPGELLATLASVEDNDIREQLVLVGHNPGFTQLANRLVPALRLINLPTAGAVCIDCDIERWDQVDAANPALVFYDYPKNPEPVRDLVEE